MSNSNDLLNSVLEAHGGLERWNQITSIDATLNISGALPAMKGYPGHYRATASVSTKTQRTVNVGFSKHPENSLIFETNKCWIQRPDGTIVAERDNPRGAFADHVRTTQWDDLHLAYFTGYAAYNYFTSPFCFTFPGFSTKEVEPHHEAGQTWRVLEVTYPDFDVFAAHSKVQKYFFHSKTFMLMRLDYVADVVGSSTSAAHYCYDHKRVGGLVFPFTRRVVRKEGDEPLLHGPSSFLLDFIEYTVHEGNGNVIKGSGEWVL